MNYYNENDKFAAAWLRNLIADKLIPNGVVDDRSITEVTPADLAGFRQCHFFAGIGGWSLALGLAGVSPDVELWTGSAPCQPYSCAGKGEGNADPRNLWPQFFALIQACRPPLCMGEQVPDAIRHGWLDRVFDGLEGEAYTCWAIDLPACSAGSPTVRQRLFWLADASSETSGRHPRGLLAPQERIGGEGQFIGGGNQRFADDGDDGLRLAFADGKGSWTGRTNGQDVSGRQLELGREDARMVGFWSNFNILPCSDGSARRVESGSFPLAHGIPRDTRAIVARLCELGIDSKAAKRIIADARRNRVGRLRGYGNAIVPAVAAEFVKSYLDINRELGKE